MVPWCRSLRPALVLCALTLSLPALAQSLGPAPASVPSCEPWVARLISYQGTISTRRASGFQQASVSLNETFCVGDVLEIGAFSRAALQLPDQTVVRLDQGTVITFAAPQDEKRTWLDILKGAVHIISRDPRALRVFTPFANAGIEGTEFFVGVGGDATTVIVYEGRVKVENPAGAATAGSGESVMAKTGSAPVLQQVVRPRDAVVWTLYYPPTSSGSLPAADAEPGAGAGADFYIARAEQRLAVGQVTDAEADLDAALKLAPGSGEVLARQSVIALTQNDTAAAVELASKAVAAAPDSAAARLAESYARQATTDLPGAISALQAAAAAHPDNALVRARLAQLWFGAGEVDRSEAEAKAAVAADPKLGLARTILGFVKLARVQLNEARAAFDEAIQLDPNDPLPRLGLGLAKIRDGDLAAGREEIETAVILDPNNSLIRSYIGKAYYEEKRDKLAASQLGIAKELDPNDPTPWFYDAIRKQTVNDPVGALENLQQSIQKNDNRAVYRSRLELDQDLAARSAGIGRIYSDLAFDELALREGARSTAIDPADFSGHRLLADSYASLPRHEIARVNELFQSQMLQPLILNPVQAQLGEANLFILDSAGPSSIAFNEFNPLFNSDGLTAQASAVVGNNGTVGADGVLAGINGRLSFSLGGYHFESDGFRDNTDVNQDTYNALVQYQQSPETSWLAEVRDSRREFGELKVLFLPGIDAGVPRQEEDSTTFRVGVRHELNPRSSFVAVANYSTGDTAFSDLEPNFTSGTDFDTYSGEIQYLYTGNRWRLVTGLRYLTGNFDSTTTIRGTLPEPPFDFESTTTDSFDTRNLSAYGYTMTDLTSTLVLTLGLSYDDLNGQTFDRNQLNPKFGLTWSPTDSTEIRIGALSTLQRPAVTRREIIPSLEPTTIAGFNQFFFGSEGETDDRYGIGIDQQLGDRLHVGGEYSTSKLEVPFQEGVFIPPDQFELVGRKADVDEQQGRAYVYWAAGDRGALRGFYEYYSVDAPIEFSPLRFTRVETHWFGAGVSYFGPLGFSAGVTPSYVHQRGRFQELANPPPPFLPDSDNFLVVDAYLAYRLPRRTGIIRLEANNLFDQTFNFQDIDPETPRIAPERFVLLKVTLAY